MMILLNDGSTYGAERDGAFFNFITNGDYVFKGIGNEFKATYSTLSLLVTVSSGEGVCGGRHVTEKRVNGATSQITLPANSTGYLTIRINGDSVSLYTTDTLVHGNLNNGDLIRDLPLYAYVTGANNILSFVDMRPISSGNGFLLRMENDVLYADYTYNGRKYHKKIATKGV